MTAEMTAEMTDLTLPFTFNLTSKITTPTSPTTLPTTREISSKCIKEGFFRDPSDATCRKYYRCVPIGSNRFAKYNMEKCGNGTIFDESKCTCNYPYAARPPCPGTQDLLT